VDANSRKQLPFLSPDVPAPVWKIIRGLIGQDLTRVSMPVIMNEPLSALQRMAEIFISGGPWFSKAAECDDSLLRIVYCFLGGIV
jgi:hypothetical protein